MRKKLTYTCPRNLINVVVEIRDEKCVSILLPGPGTQRVEMMGGREEGGWRGGDVTSIAPHTMGIQNCPE